MEFATINFLMEALYFLTSSNIISQQNVALSLSTIYWTKPLAHSANLGHSPVSSAIFLDLCFFLFRNHQSPCNTGGRFH